MNWYDLKFDEKTEDEFNWKVRYDFLIKNVDDMNYILSRCHAKRVGNLYVSICPLPSHNEKTGSFTIFPPETIGRDGKPQGKTTFCCFGCGIAGDIITFYQHYNSLNNRREACEAFEKELGIDIKRTDFKNQMLLEGLNEVNNSNFQIMDFNMVNLTCSRICRDYLNWIRKNHKQSLKKEFYDVQEFFKEFDEEIMELTGIDTIKMIDKTTNFINNKKKQYIKSSKN